MCVCGAHYCDEQLPITFVHAIIIAQGVANTLKTLCKTGSPGAIGCLAVPPTSRYTLSTACGCCFTETPSRQSAELSHESLYYILTS